MRKELHIFYLKLLQGNGLLNYPHSEGTSFPKFLSSVWEEEAEAACSMTLGSAVRHMHADVRKASCTLTQVVNSNVHSCLGKLSTAVGFGGLFVLFFNLSIYFTASPSSPLRPFPLTPLLLPTPFFCLHLDKGRSPMSISRTWHIKLQ